ncbi:MAG: DoxX family protein [Chlamydiia bacterium]|nr:DoxX family protein [Chlamydiia bacterium]
MCRKIAVVLGRILMAAIFILSGVSKLFNWSGSLQHLVSTFSDWHAYLGQSPLFAKAISMAPLLLAIAIALELIGGCSVLIGYRPRWGATLLILFLIPTTILVHHFWFLEGQARADEQISFIKNCAILGGLLILWASNMDRRRVSY